MRNIVITISRQYGSGGKTIGAMLAKELGINCYSREILRMASEDSGINEKLFGMSDEKVRKAGWFKLLSRPYEGGLIPPEDREFTSDDNLFNYQAKVIKELAAKESCVIVGRCSDYVLRNEENLVSVFVRAGIDFRTERIMKSYDMKEKSALDYILKTDKRRSSFYNFYTNRIWGSVDNYDISVNTERVDTDGAAQVIVDYVKQIKHPNPKESEIY